MRIWAWRLYGTAGIVSTCAYMLLSGTAEGLIYDLLGISAVVAIMVGLRMNHERRSRPWYALALGNLLFVTGHVIWNFYDTVFDAAGFPSVADGFYLAAYPMIAMGLLLLIRRRAPGKDRASLLDAALITLATGAVAWTFLMGPYVHDPSLTIAEQAVWVVYPMMDVLLVAVAVRLMVIPARRTIPLQLLIGSLVFLLVGDAAHGATKLLGIAERGGPVDTIALVSYVLLGCAALHPSVRSVSVRPAVRKTELGNGRLALLAVTSLTGPALVAIQTLRGEPIDVPVIVGVSAIMFLLVLIRLADLVRDAERGKLLDEVLQSTEHERLHLAAELHDGPIQTFTALGYNLERGRLRLANERVAEADKTLEGAQGDLSDGIKTLRRVVAEMRPPALEEKGLAEAVGEYVREFRDASHVETTIETRLDDSLPPSVELALYRLTQEALRNVEKHAGAATVSVSLGMRNASVVLEIADDGKGFDPDAAMEAGGSGHFGLAGMRGRVEMAGGRFDISSRPGKGSKVVAAIPMEGAAR